MSMSAGQVHSPFQTVRKFGVEPEEIIKEGRKFGVFLTIASQRPADIFPTIVSQIHNFLIHRLVNDRNLLLIDNTSRPLIRFHAR